VEIHIEFDKNHGIFSIRKRSDETPKPLLKGRVLEGLAGRLREKEMRKKQNCSEIE
jgi:hypothetical protein